MARTYRSISTTVILACVTVALSIAILVGWTLLIVQNTELTRQVVANTWLLVTGVVSLVVIMTVLVLFSVFFIREILKVRRQDSFIDSVTHELKSPLASLKLCAETLARDELSASQREDVRVMMVADVERLSVFIDDVLEASRIAHGRTGQTVSEIDVGALLARCAESVAKRHRVAADAIRIHAGAPVRVVSDATALEVVFRNLIDNAVKYSNAPVCVDVTIEGGGGADVVVAVRDQGIGIAKRHVRRVFDRFFRAPAEEVRTRHGTGLGLFVVAALVRDLGGRAVAESEGVNRGMTMTVTLPDGSARRGAA